MITMDLEGMTWVGNLYHEFENICLEAEDIIYQDTVNYIENQMQAVGETVKKLYADVMQDLLPPSSCDLDEMVVSELHTDQDTYVGFCKKPDQGFKETPLKADKNQTTNDTRINHDVDNDTIHPASYDETCETNVVTASSGDSVKGSNFISRSGQCVQSMDIKSDLAIDENQENKKMVATMISDEITSAETNGCRTSQSCDLSNENENPAVSDSKAASTEVTGLLAPAVDYCYYEIENASTERIPDDPVLVKSREEKLMNTCYSPGVLFGESDSFSMDRAIDSDYCNSTVILSHPDTKNLEVTKIDTFEERHKTMQQDQLKLEETCVMVIEDELQFVHKQLKTNKKWRPSFSLSKKSARKQEYKELALLHGNNEKVKGDCMENSDPTSLENQDKLLFPSMSEPEWEIL